MKFATVFACLLAFAASQSTLRNGRRYNPQEEDAYRTRYLTTVDKNGKLYVEDLFRPVMTRGLLSDADVTFYLYTQANLDNPEMIIGNDFTDLEYSNFFHNNRTTKFIVHGWNNNRDSPVNSLIKDALLEHHDINVFVVDWERPANEFYTSAKAAVPYIGTVVGDFIMYLINYHELSWNQVTIVGHSLGAHVAGKAGHEVKSRINKKIFNIVALDPASPLFNINKLEERIDTEDAQYVQVIHTNGALLGFDSSLGHADYYPNGGKKQSGCGLDLLGICSHGRAYEYYAESIPSSEFVGQLCDNMNSFENGQCDRNHASKMGELLPDMSAEGDYYLKTNTDKPFALGDLRKRRF